MSFDRAAALATIEKLENKKLRIPTPGMIAGAAASLKQAIVATKTDELEALALATAKDGTGKTDYALATLVPLPTGPEQRRKAGVLAGRQVIVGDLVVEGPLTITGATLVTGSVRASAVSVAEAGVLVVNGNLEARVVSGDGWLWVRGDVKVELALGYHRVGELRVGGSLDATLGIMSNHVCEAKTNAVRHWFVFDGAPKEEDARYLALLALVTDKAVVPEETKAEHGIHRVDFRALARLAALKQPLLHTGKPKDLSPKKRAEPPPPAKAERAKTKGTKGTKETKGTKAKGTGKATKTNKVKAPAISKPKKTTKAARPAAPKAKKPGK